MCNQIGVYRVLSLCNGVLNCSRRLNANIIQQSNTDEAEHTLSQKLHPSQAYQSLCRLMEDLLVLLL